MKERCLSEFKARALYWVVRIRVTRPIPYAYFRSFYIILELFYCMVTNTYMNLIFKSMYKILLRLDYNMI